MLDGRSVVLVVMIECLAAVSLQAQPAETVARVDTSDESGYFFDGVVIGGGIVIYEGELDRNPFHSLGQYLASGGLDITMGVERTFDGSFFQLNGRFSYVKGGDEYVQGHSYCCGFSNKVLSLNGITGISLHLFGREHMVRLFTGLGVLHHLPINNNPELLPELGFGNINVLEGQGMWALSIPIGVSFLRSVRVTGRLVLTDYLDNAASGRPYDFILHVNAVHRFSLSP